jgi:SAM-dependent methyltransferase
LFVPTGNRPHALCPKCGAYERHRLQFLVMQKLQAQLAFETLDLLHFAPEPAFRDIFRNMFRSYTTADLSMRGVDHHVDITSLPFGDQSYDAVFASHVLEHIPDDKKALAEIRRILRPGGFAVLPVPISSPITIEYDRPNPQESGHVRSPGPDYLERYEDFFDRIEEFTSADFREEYQLFVCYPASAGSCEGAQSSTWGNLGRTSDAVPVCFVGNEPG